MDEAGPHRDLPQHGEIADRVAERRPDLVRAPTYAEVALKLLDQCYEPFPILPGQKRPAVPAWTTVVVDRAQVEAWKLVYGHCGVGLRTGQLVAVDSDVLDADLSHKVAEIVQLRLGRTEIRVGRWPKQLLIYRTSATFAKRTIPQLEVLAKGQQFVAFGIHPDTRLPYSWPEESPLDVALDRLPLVNEGMIDALVAELAGILGTGDPSSRGGGRRNGGPAGQRPVRNVSGLVVNGRDQWLSTIAFHAVHDAIDRGVSLDPDILTDTVWTNFANSTDLSRPKSNGRLEYSPNDARAKVRDKIRLHRDGRLPGRNCTVVDPAYLAPTLSIDDARAEMEANLAHSMAAIHNWHANGGIDAAPRVGIRATVGLGKSTAARRKITGLLAQQTELGLPRRLLNFTSSLALADETAAAWADLGVGTAVLRGYEARHPASAKPMCQDIAGVKAAIAAGVDIQSSVCWRSQKQHCPHFASCPKQRNRQEVANAQVVVAASDAMFTGFAGDKADFALVLIDEACWDRAFEQIEGLTVDALPLLGIGGIAASRRQDAEGARLADVAAARQKLADALAGLGAGEVTRTDLIAAGLDAAFLLEGRITEQAALPDAGLRPGQSASERRWAVEGVTGIASLRNIMALWAALEELLSEDHQAAGKVWVDGPRSSDGQRPLRIYRRKAIAADIANRPILHLDATLRPELAETVLPGLKVSTFEAAAPHQHVRLVSGGFGKAKLTQDRLAAPDENQRRANRLKECVDYVRWQAMRHAPGKVLVITYKGIEEAFAGIPGAETMHYNAVAGLDRWGDVAALILIGRLLPQSDDLRELTGAVLGRSVTGQYTRHDVGIWTETDRKAVIRAIRHEEVGAEILRAAICDDEVMQSLGRGRGVNRTAANPLEVHVLADVVLPIAYERVQAWQVVCPDIVQEMLLGGIEADSPADAARMHPDLFGSVDAADCAFRRVGFNRQNPIGNIYRNV